MKRLRDLQCHEGVETGGGLVAEKHRWVRENLSSERKALRLTARDALLDAAETDPRVLAVDEAELFEYLEHSILPACKTYDGLTCSTRFTR